jgi:hypothetical protein
MQGYRVGMALFAALSVSARGGSAAQSQPGTTRATSNLNANIATEAAGMNVSDGLTLLGQITGSGTQTLQATITLPSGTYASSDCNVLYSQEGEGLSGGLWSGTSDLRNTTQNMICGTSGQIELQGCSQ